MLMMVSMTIMISLGGTLLALGAVVVVVALGWILLRLTSPRQTSISRAVRQFRSMFPQLQRQFFQLASASGKPRDLIWTRIDWAPDTLRLARDRETGLLTAFVGIEIVFAATPGGDMEEVEAVADIRQASATFHYQNNRWGTGGKVIFNLSPPEAVERLKDQLEPVEIH